MTLAVLLATLPALAAKRDLRILSVLDKVGAQSEQFMSQTHYGLNSIECAASVRDRSFDCSAEDASANGGEGASLELRGLRAKALFRLLVQLKAPTDNGMGKIFISAKSVYCTQSVEGVAEGSAASRTRCDVRL